MRIKFKKPGIGQTGGFVAIVLAAGCTMNPIGQTQRPVSVAPSAPVTSTLPSDMPSGTTTSSAEQACMGAGRERNLDVVGVVGSSSAADANGEPTRDVMLRVRRNGSEIEVRCNYASSTGVARIMLI